MGGPNRDGGSTLTIAGPGLWRRPVVGTENGELIVQAEERFGSRPFTVSNYLVEVFGDELTEHIAQHSVSAPPSAAWMVRSGRRPEFASGATSPKTSNLCPNAKNCPPSPVEEGAVFVASCEQKMGCRYRVVKLGLLSTACRRCTCVTPLNPTRSRFINR